MVWRYKLQRAQCLVTHIIYFTASSIFTQVAIANGLDSQIVLLSTQLEDSAISFLSQELAGSHSARSN